jgi:DNA mismatch repair protein MutL
VYQVFGRETLDQLIPLAAVQPLERVGLPPPPPWRRSVETSASESAASGAGDQPSGSDGADTRTGVSAPHDFGEVRLHGFVSKPEIQKLNRNSIFIFVNGRLIRDRLIQHAIIEAYRNILPPTVFPVVLLFIEMPTAEVDVNVHPSKTEVRFRQQTVIHDFVRESVRAALMKARPVPQFLTEIVAQPSASRGLSSPGLRNPSFSEGAGTGDGLQPAPWRDLYEPATAGGFALQAPSIPAATASFQFEGGIAVESNAAVSLARAAVTMAEPAIADHVSGDHAIPDDGCAPPITQEPRPAPTLESLRTLRPLGQIRNSFILAVNEDGLWIIDQHVAHERVLFERVLRQRSAQRVESQRLLMPLVIELTPAQQAIFSEIADELARNGFEAEPFGARSVAVKIAPAGVDAAQIEHILNEILEQLTREDQATNLEAVRTRIAASVACHAAIKVNMPLEQNKMEWLLAELAKTEHPMTCPHGRPVVLRYSMQDIQKAFKRI